MCCWLTTLVTLVVALEFYVCRFVYVVCRFVYLGFALGGVLIYFPLRVFIFFTFGTPVDFIVVLLLILHSILRFLFFSH